MAHKEVFGLVATVLPDRTPFWAAGVIGMLLFGACGAQNQTSVAPKRQLNALPTAESFEYDVELARTRGGLFTLDASSNEVELKVLLDTGVPTFFVIADVQANFADQFDGQSMITGPGDVELQVQNIRKVSIEVDSAQGTLHVLADYGLAGELSGAEARGINFLLNPRFLAVGGWLKVDYENARISVGRSSPLTECSFGPSMRGDFIPITTDWNYGVVGTLLSGDEIQIVFDTGSEVTLLYDPEATSTRQQGVATRSATTVFGDIDVAQAEEVVISIGQEKPLRLKPYISSKRAIAGADLIVGMDVMKEAQLLICDGHAPRIFLPLNSLP